MVCMDFALEFIPALQSEGRRRRGVCANWCRVRAHCAAPPAARRPPAGEGWFL